MTIRAASIGSLHQTRRKAVREDDHAWHKVAQMDKSDTCPARCTEPRPYELEPGLFVCRACLNLDLCASPRMAAYMSARQTP